METVGRRKTKTEGKRMISILQKNKSKTNKKQAQKCENTETKKKMQ